MTKKTRKVAVFRDGLDVTHLYAKDPDSSR